jgi:hypothetical protein
MKSVLSSRKAAALARIAVMGAPTFIGQKNGQRSLSRRAKSRLAGRKSRYLAANAVSAVPLGRFLRSGLRSK